MPTASRLALALGALSLLVLSSPGVSARSKVVAKKSFVQTQQINGELAFDDFHEFPEGALGGFGFGMDPGPFAMFDAPVGGAQAPAAAVVPASLAGSRIAAFRGGSLSIDEDSGTLVRADKNGNAVAQVEIGRGASQLIVDAKADRAYVVDRTHDRVAVVEIGTDLKVVDGFTTRTEPFGIALAPDRKTLLVTTIADRTLSAIDIATGSERWSVEIGPEPRGVAIAPSGEDAIVTFLTTGAVARVQLGDLQSRPKIAFVTIDPPARQPNFRNGQRVDDSHSDEGKSFARNAFAAIFVGHDVAVVPHQLSTPHLASDDFQPEASGYGGGNGFTAPVNHRLAFLAMPDAGSKGGVRMAMASTNVHQPRALAYDGQRDTLYVAGFGSDDVLAIANVSQASLHSTWQMNLAEGSSGCGPDGLAVDPADGDVLVWCSLQRKVVRLAADAKAPTTASVVARSDALTKTHLSDAAQRGRDLFRKGKSAQISSFGAMACSSCHAEARADSLSWRLQGKNLQTPLLAGRIADAHPFKWDGKDPDITASLTNTVTRLGGSGISRREAADLAAFLETLEPPRAPAVDDPAAVARGKELFEGQLTGCASCHNGTLYTDQNQYDVGTDLGDVDTPSLVGLASSAPYYHDGSAATLDALLRDNASVHGMSDTSKLTDAQISDLAQFLKTL